jgi:hypothetical protein
MATSAAPILSNTQPPAAAPAPATNVTTGANGQDLTSSQETIYDQVQATLSGYGFTPAQLSQIMTFITNSVVNGDSVTQISNAIPNLPAFQQRFPAIAQRQAAGLPPITVADYLSTEQSYAQAEQQAGLPANWTSYDALIGANVSPAEYSSRLTQGFEVINNAPADVQQAFQSYYAQGISPSALAAYFLNPQAGATLLAQQAQSALIGQAAQQAGFNAGHQYGAGTGVEGLSQAEALRLSQMNVSQSQAQTGFAKIAQEQQNLQQLPGQKTAVPTQDQVLNATFGSDGATQEQIQLNQQQEINTDRGTNQTGTTQVGQQGAGAIQR